MSGQPSWITEDVCVTSRKIFMVTASEKYEPKTRFRLLFEIFNRTEKISNNFLFLL